jgi:hypothetical protein
MGMVLNGYGTKCGPEEGIKDKRLSGRKKCGSVEGNMWLAAYRREEMRLSCGNNMSLVSYRFDKINFTNNRFVKCKKRKNFGIF